VPVSRYVKERQTFDGNLTVGRHLVFRLPQYRDYGNFVYPSTTFP